MSAAVSERHQITRVRHELKRRQLTVTTVSDITPKMRRITFTAPELVDFVSASPDDHIKLFFPDPANPDAPVMRDYTPRAYDPAALSLTIDFALHDTGIASDWARQARPGDRLAIGGPRGSMVVPDDFDYYLLVGDETALPAIGRRVEALRPGVPVVTVIVVDGPADVQHFTTKADWRPYWAYRGATPSPDDGAALCAALADWVPPPGDGYAWVAAEALVARQLRDYLLTVRQHPKQWLKAAGYWVRGAAGASEKMEA